MMRADMAESNADRIRRSYDAWNRGDFDAAMTDMHEGVEWQMSGDIVGTARAYHGHEGVRAWWLQFREPFEEVDIDAEEIVEVSGDRVLVRVRLRARGRQGIEVDLSVSHLYEFSHGKVIRTRVFTDHAEARAAVELP